MPLTKNPFLRYVVIDTCLRNTGRRWTIDDLTQKCSDAQFDYTGLGISKRTIQNDLQFMRGEFPGFCAPIVVRDNKYYVYADPDYDILPAIIHLIQSYRGEKM